MNELLNTALTVMAYAGFALFGLMIVLTPLWIRAMVKGGNVGSSQKPPPAA